MQDFASESVKQLCYLCANAKDCCVVPASISCSGLCKMSIDLHVIAFWTC